MMRLFVHLSFFATTLALADAPDGFKSMFNGKDLTEWDGSPTYWKVENGVLTGTADGTLKYNRFIVWRGGKVKNFEWRAKVRVSPGGNSGLQYRSAERPDLGESVVVGYQCDVVSNRTDYNGMLYEERGRRILAHTGEKVIIDAAGQPWVVDKLEVKEFKAGEWHDFRVLVEGNRHRHWIDGHLTVDVIDLDEKGRKLEGILGMQVHVGPKMTIEYKDLYLKKLADDLPLIGAAQAPIPKSAVKVVPQGQDSKKKSSGAATSPVQESFTITLKDRAEGESILLKRSETTVNKFAVRNGGAVLAEELERNSEMVEFKESVLKREAGKAPTKFVRHYTKAQSGKDDKLEASPLEGQTVVIERKGGVYSFASKEGKQVAAAVADLLTKEFSRRTEDDLDRMVLPTMAVKVGETWKIDMPKVAAMLGKLDAIQFDGAKAIGQGTLIKVYRKEDRQFGEMKFNMTFPLLAIGKDKEQLKLSAGAQVVLDVVFDVCIDGKSATGRMTTRTVMNAVLPPDGNGFITDIHGTTDSVQTIEESAKD